MVRDGFLGEVEPGQRPEGQGERGIRSSMSRQGVGRKEDFSAVEIFELHPERQVVNGQRDTAGSFSSKNTICKDLDARSTIG